MEAEYRSGLTLSWNNQLVQDHHPGYDPYKTLQTIIVNQYIGSCKYLERQSGHICVTKSVKLTKIILAPGQRMWHNW